MAYDVATRVLTGEKITVQAIREGKYVPASSGKTDSLPPQQSQLIRNNQPKTP